MGKVLQLNELRRRKTRAYRHRFAGHMDRFLAKFARDHLPCNFEMLRHLYTEQLITEHEHCWDYLDFRDSLVQGLSSSLGATLLGDLAREWWFDKRYYTLDEIIESLVTSYILNRFALPAEM